MISERRTELATLCPELPAFDGLEEMEVQIERHLRDAALFAEARKASVRRLARHTYAQRLAASLGAALDGVKAAVPVAAPAVQEAESRAESIPQPIEMAPEWKAHAECLRAESEGVIVLEGAGDRRPGSERGLVGVALHTNVAVEFEVHLRPDTEFVAKLHQAEANNQLTDSYHLLTKGGNAYLARHNHILRRLTLPLHCWTPIVLSYHDGVIMVRKNGVTVAQACDRMLPQGYCFLGVKAGAARLRNFRILPIPAEPKSIATRAPDFDLIEQATRTAPPTVSIITTVYDRLECLERCLESADALNFRDYEQIVVADSPPPAVVDQLTRLAARWKDSGRLTFANLKARANNWGIAPAAAGLALARGRFVSFLSDDNGYLPAHFDRLVATMENDPLLGFVYSSCLYDGRLTLGTSPPRAGRIDLGQPLFQRKLFDQHLNGTLPFHEFGWDWRMIECFLRSGVRWRHINDATFIFRLAKYPHLMPQRLLA